MQENFPPAATGALRMQWSLTEPDTLFEHLLQDLPAETSHFHIPPDDVAFGFGRSRAFGLRPPRSEPMRPE